MNRNLGVFPSPPDYRDYRVEKVIEPIRLPKAVRLDDRFRKVLNQGWCGACVGKGCNAILSAEHDTDLSSLYIYSRCKELDGFPNSEGTYPRIAMRVIAQEGSCRDETLPYSELKVCTITPQITSRMMNEASRYKASEYARAWNLHDIKQTLAHGYLLGATFWVGDNWMHYNGGIMYPSYNINIQGLHWVAICGYDDDKQAIRGLNSWGESWGDKGFFWLSYDAFDSNDYVEGWAIKVNKNEPAPEPKKTCYQKFISKIKNIFQ